MHRYGYATALINPDCDDPKMAHVKQPATHVFRKEFCALEAEAGYRKFDAESQCVGGNTASQLALALLRSLWASYDGEAGLPPVASVTLLYDFHTDKPDDTGKALDAPLAALLRAAHPADRGPGDGNTLYTRTRLGRNASRSQQDARDAPAGRGPGDGRHTRETDKADGDGRRTRRQTDKGDAKADAPGPGMSGKGPGDGGGASNRGGRRRDVVTLVLSDHGQRRAATSLSDPGPVPV